jgi:CubicO group peptidase (beta-lactamase class C family)
LYGKYVQNGTIDLDRTLKELNINESPDSLSEMEQTAIVRMLLKARSGVYHDYVGGRPGMKKNQPERNSHEPGTYWYYNNWDFNTLGTIFEQETKTTIGTSFKEQIADRIGMTNFYVNDVYYLQDNQSVHKQYHFRLTATNLAKLGQLMIQNGQWNNEKIISAEWIRESTSSYSQTDRGTGYGYMWWISNKGVLFEGVTLPDNSYAAFGAVGKYLIIIPEYDLVIAHVQTREWPDNASRLPKSDLPSDEEITETDEMGPLIKLILDARKN